MSPAEIDMGRAMALRQEINHAVDSDSRVTVNDLIVKACALALGRHPKFNASFSDGALEFHTQVNIGIAIALESGFDGPRHRQLPGQEPGGAGHRQQGPHSAGPQRAPSE